jgi:hypothetical protein
VAKVLIQSLSIELPLDEIYADIELPAVRADNAAEPGEV